MQQSDKVHLTSLLIVGVLAFLLVGGTMALLLLGRQVPEFIIGFDGVIVTASFGAGPFFAAARNVATSIMTSRDIAGMHHALAIAALPIPSTRGTGTSETPGPIGGSDGG